jgi:hypothetical protein
MSYKYCIWPLFGLRIFIRTISPCSRGYRPIDKCGSSTVSQRPDFASVLKTNQTGKKVRLFKNNELKRNRSSLSPELTNPNEHRVRFSKDYRTQPKRTKGSLISPCSLTFGERAHQKKAESSLELP